MTTKAITRLVTLYLLTADGLVRVRVQPHERKAEVLGTSLQGDLIRNVCLDPFDPRRVYLTTVHNVFVSEDGGDTFEWRPAGGVDYREFWTMAVHPGRPGHVYLGTLPAAVYVSEDNGRSFRELAGFRQLPDFERWTFPPAPHTAHVRCITLDAAFPDEVLVAVEEGGLARSRDNGTTWEDISGPPSTDLSYPKVKDVSGKTPYEFGTLEEGRVYRDCHVIMRRPGAADHYYATTGMGSYWSENGGRSWSRFEYGVTRGYAVLLVNAPNKPERLTIGAATNVPWFWKTFTSEFGGPFYRTKYARIPTDPDGARPVIVQSNDYGKTWRHLTDGLPIGTPYMLCGLVADPIDGDTMFVSYTDGSIYLTTDGGDHWSLLLDSGTRLAGLQIGPA